MSNDDMPEWARDMRIVVMELMARVERLEKIEHERRDSEILDPSPRAIAERAVRKAESARGIVNSVSDLAMAQLKGVRDLQNLVLKQGERIAELEQHLRGFDKRPDDKPNLKW